MTLTIEKTFKVQVQDILGRTKVEVSPPNKVVGQYCEFIKTNIIWTDFFEYLERRRDVDPHELVTDQDVLATFLENYLQHNVSKMHSGYNVKISWV